MNVPQFIILMLGRRRLKITHLSNQINGSYLMCIDINMLVMRDMEHVQAGEINSSLHLDLHRHRGPMGLFLCYSALYSVKFRAIPVQ